MIRSFISLKIFFPHKKLVPALFVSILICTFLQLNAQDNTPPQLLSPARDTSFECGVTPDIIAKLTDWYNNAGGARASDNSDTFTWRANRTLQQTITIFNNSLDVLCGNKQRVDVTFSPVDTSGNIGSVTTASFFTTDTRGPRITNSVPNLQYKCVQGIRDTLMNWIKKSGGYIAIDNCSNSVTWKNFNYSISSNNSIIQTGGGNIDNGPYPQIPDGICQWTMNISFIAADECGNESGTPGTTTFSVTDDVPPVFINPPSNITVNCDKVPAAAEAIVSDDCDKTVKAVLNQTTTQVANPDLCGFYNYTITRNWVATDKCGNSSTYRQLITVVDTTAPVVKTIDAINISCTLFALKTDSIFITFSDNCSKVSVSKTDSIISQGCQTRIQRTYTLTDICQNHSIHKQIIQIGQDAKPEITTAAINQSYLCTSQENIEGLLATWIQNKGGSAAKTACGILRSFAAIKGTYDINNPASFPGTLPVSLPKQQCPATLNQFLRYLEVDFVYYDSCGNSAVTSAIFGIKDNEKPVLTECPSPVVVSVDQNDCSANIKIKVPSATDNCVESESPVTRQIISLVTSTGPTGPEAIVNPVNIRIGPINPSLANPLADGILKLRLRNLDIDDVTEYFNIFDEDGINIGKTPVGAGQCASTDFIITLNKNKIAGWIQDGYIELTFRPNIIAGSPVLSINNICNGGAIEATLSYDIEITNTVRKAYKINQGAEVVLNNETEISVDFDKGSHTVTFLFRDCANNTTECSVPITVKDEVGPVIVCPQNISSTLSPGVCTDTISLPVNFTVNENCAGTYKYERRSPLSTEASLISFVFNEGKLKYEARSKEMVFNNVFPIKHVNIPVVLDVEFTGDNDESGEYFEIFGPGGFLIGNTALSFVSGKCNVSKTRFEIDRSLFNTWITNNQVSLLAIPKNGGDGINPCTAIIPGQSIDNTSTINATLKYSDAVFSIVVTGATFIDGLNIPNGASAQDLILNSGINMATITTRDDSGNTASCSFTIDVRDVEKPKAKCKNIVVNLHPSGLQPVMILPEMINNGSTDNCMVEKMTVVPSSVDCSASNSDVAVQLIVVDKQGNSDTCTANIRVKSPEVKPTFSAGLCSTDTLKFFANVPPASIPGTYSFFWDGPGGIDFFTENPQIPNADESYNGVYVLTVKGFNNCTSVGSVTVNIKPLIKPELSSPAREVCSGENVILNTTNYSGEIQYLWYEGIFPTGVLIRSTASPELILKPTSGVHFYYIIAKGPDCSSNPSTLLKVDVKEIPVPEPCNRFLSLCEGADLVLCAKGNTSYNYKWTGPAGYSGMGQSPVVINGVTALNGGEYRLVVSNGSCLADTSVTRLVILEKPSQPVIVSADIFCEGAIFSMVATSSPNAEKFEWFRNGSLFTTSQENSLIITNAQSGLQGSWSVISVKGNCKSLTSPNKFIAIDNSLEVGAINTGPVCMGDSVRLQATFVPNATYRWQGPVASIPAVFDPLIPGVPGDYSVSITTPTGCQNNANTTVSVISVPEITALSNDSKPCVAPGEQIRFSPSVFPNSDIYTFQWRGPSGYSSNNKNPVISNLSPKDTGIYSLVIFNGRCPSNKLETRVNFNLIPQKPSATSAPFFCEGDTIKIIGSDLQNNAEYNWNTPLGKFTTKESFYILPNGSITNQGKYTLETKVNGCFSPPSDSIEIIVRKKPEIPLIASNSPVCFGDTVKISTNPINGAQYLWSGPTMIGSVANINIPAAAKSNEGVYSLKIKNNGCTSNISSPLQIVVKDEIKIPAFSVNSLALCSDKLTGTQICLNPLSLEQGAIYRIFNETKKINIASGNTNCYLITDTDLLSIGTNFITAKTQKDQCLSSVSPALVVNVNTPPSITARALEDDIRTCPGEEVRLVSVTGPPLVSVKWTALNPENIISDRNSVSPVISGLKSGINFVYLEYSIEGCPDFTRDTVKIYSEFIPVSTDDAYRLTYGEKGQLNVLQNDKLPDQIIFTITSQPQYGKVTINNKNIEYLPDLRVLRPVEFTYKVCAQLCDNLCTGAKVKIEFDDNIECKAPSIFTPNNDGMNDNFVIPCLDTGRFPSSKLYIFNEWGQEVFYSSPYKNDWDGTYVGKPLPVGTYYYIMDTGENRKPVNGFLILQR